MQNFASKKTNSLFSAALSAPTQVYQPPVIEKSLEERRSDREAVISLQKSLYKAIVKGDLVECDDCPELQSLVKHIEAFAKAEHPEASKAVRKCVSTKIPTLINEGKPEDQAVAIAFTYCSKRG